MTAANQTYHNQLVFCPILQKMKAEIIHQGASLGVDYAQTVSCYQANESGQACGKCDSCRLRAEGFEAAGVVDPTHYY